MAVQIDDERGVVAGSVVRAEPRPAVVGCTVAKGGRVERVDRLSRGCGEGEVEPGSGGGGLRRAHEGELVLSGFDPVAREPRRVEHPAIPERGERGVVERRRALEVHDREGSVVDHEVPFADQVAFDAMQRSSAVWCLSLWRWQNSSNSAAV
jgi:hypothetical protein